MTTQGIDHYAIRVSGGDLYKITDFYVRIVGLQDGFRPADGAEGRWLYAGGKDVLHITVDNDLGGGEPVGAHSVSCVSFQCTELARVVELLNQEHLDFEVISADTSGVGQVYFRDPDGRGIELIFQA